MREVSANRINVRTLPSAWLPVVFCIAVIMLESTATFGADHTNGPLRALFEAIFGAVNNAEWPDIHHLIRKTGHFVGYGIIGLVWLRAWRLSAPRISLWIAFLLALIGTAFMAGSDELHQSFLPNRTGMFSDVVLDCSAALMLLLITCIWLKVRSLGAAEKAA